MPPPIFYKLVLFFGYPVLSLFFMWLGLANIWGTAIIIFSAGIIFFMSILLAGPIIRQSPGFYSFFIFTQFASSTPLIIYIDNKVYVALGLCLIYILSAVALLILQRAIPSRKYLQPDSEKVFLIYWLVFVTSSAILTSVGLASLSYKVNFILVLVYGFVFGWLGPEVTYRFLGRTNRDIKAAALMCILVVSLAFFQSALATNPTLQPLSVDTIILVMTLLSVPSMLISRIILEELEHE